MITEEETREEDSRSSSYNNDDNRDAPRETEARQLQV